MPVLGGWRVATRDTPIELIDTYCEANERGIILLDIGL